MEALAGQRAIESGEILIDGAVYARTRRQMRNNKVFLLPEEPLRNGCVRSMTVAENLAFRNFDRRGNTFGHWLVNRAALRRQASALIQRYGIKTQGPDALIETLSGGNVQRTVLARELHEDVKVLIAQNPCFGLDIAAVAEIRNQIMNARNAGASVLLISEDLDELLELADRIVVMFEGELVYETPRNRADIATIGRHMASKAPAAPERGSGKRIGPGGESAMTSRRHTIVRGGRLLDVAGHTSVPADILVDGDTIRELGPSGMPAPDSATVVDASDCLLMPGLVNAHTHAHGALAKGMVDDRWPLEVFLNSVGPLSAGKTLEDKYLSGLLTAAEMVLKGCTASYDLFVEFPLPTVDGVHAVAQAYQDRRHAGGDRPHDGGPDPLPSLARPDRRHPRTASPADRAHRGCSVRGEPRCLPRHPGWVALRPRTDPPGAGADHSAALLGCISRRVPRPGA